MTRTRKAGFLAVALALAAMAGAPAVRADVAQARMNRASDGYVYFHCQGADMDAHDAAVDACIAAVRGTQGSYLTPPHGSTLPLAPYMLGSAADRVAFAANLENCMVATGWEVVRVDDAEGARIAALPRAGQGAVLAPWVGAAETHGVVVRRWAPVDGLAWREGLDTNPGPPALSLTAEVRDLSQIADHEAFPKTWRALPVGDAHAAYPAGASLIVVRTRTIAPAQRQWSFVRLDDGSPMPALEWFQVASPTKLFWKPGTVLEKTFVIIAPPAYPGSLERRGRCRSRISAARIAG